MFFESLSNLFYIKINAKAIYDFYGFQSISKQPYFALSKYNKDYFYYIYNFILKLNLDKEILK